MNDYELKRVELGLGAFASEKFEKPMDCKNTYQNRLEYEGFKNSCR